MKGFISNITLLDIIKYTIKYILPLLFASGVLKFYFDKKLDKQKEESGRRITELNGKIERKNHMYKIQFEREFNIYVEISEVLFDLKRKLPQLRPNLNENPATTSEEIIQHLVEYQNIYNSFSMTINKYAPFYENDIYKILLEIRDLINDEITEYKKDKVHNLFITNANEKIKSLDLRDKILSEVENKTEEFRQKVNIRIKETTII